MLQSPGKPAFMRSTGVLIMNLRDVAHAVRTVVGDKTLNLFTVYIVEPLYDAK